MISVEAGVAGFLHFAGVTLDVISVVCILITIGFAVDYTAHVCHRYEHSSGATAEEKVINTLAEIGWPILQVNSGKDGVQTSLKHRTHYATQLLVNCSGFMQLKWRSSARKHAFNIKRVT